MDVKTVICEICDRKTSDFVVYMCVNPGCDIPQHVVCLGDLSTVMEWLAETTDDETEGQESEDESHRTIGHMEIPFIRLDETEP